ncbi:MAG: class I SAM-dependent methyltransferase [Verrucomicrobiae bacterium]|nr:class I SAM-dependent methyltransferase [Verrucomicrobiae bacterium]
MTTRIIHVAIVALAAALWAVPACAQPSADSPPGQRGAAPGRDGPPPFVPPVMRALDANSDGTIDAEEIAKAPESLKKLDANNDGKLSSEEMRPRFGGIGPAGGRGSGPQGGGFGGPPRRSSEGGISFTSQTQAKSETEKKILSVLADMSQNQRRGTQSVPEEDGRILRVLAEALGAKHVVELGTSIGYSGVWFCLALQQTGGKLTTYEIDPARAARARENFKRAGVEHLVTLIEGDAHEEVKKLREPIDIVFLDADKEGYLDYLEKLLPLVRPGGLIVAHNMNQRQADPRYVKAITTNPALETLFLNMETSGIGVTLKKR